MEPTYVVVAGGAGFLGAKLCATLLSETKHHVICLDNLSYSQESAIAALRGQSRFTFIKGDASEPFLVPGKLVQLYHLCDPREATLAALKTRGEGTLKLLERALRDQARVVVCPALTDSLLDAPPGTPHAEALALAFAKEKRLDVRVARLATLFGPGMRLDANIVAEYIETALKRRPIEVEGEGQSLYSLLYLDDAVRGLLRVMEAEQTGPVFHLGMRRKVAQRELARLVARACGTRVRLAFDPADTREVKPTDALLPEQTYQLLGWEPSLSLEEALSLTVESVRPLIGPPDPKRKKRVEPQITTIDNLFRGLR